MILFLLQNKKMIPRRVKFGMAIASGSGKAARYLTRFGTGDDDEGMNRIREEVEWMQEAHKKEVVAITNELEETRTELEETRQELELTEQNLTQPREYHEFQVDELQSKLNSVARERDGLQKETKECYSKISDIEHKIEELSSRRIIVTPREKPDTTERDQLLVEKQALETKLKEMLQRHQQQIGDYEQQLEAIEERKRNCESKLEAIKKPQPVERSFADELADNFTCVE